MNTTFEDLSALAKSLYGEAFASDEGGSFLLATEFGPLEFFRAAGDPAAVIVRVRILDLANVPRASDFAKAAISGNFFWSGTRGATLSIGVDNALYATERRLLDEIDDADGLASCLDDFADTVVDWQERSALYA